MQRIFQGTHSVPGKQMTWHAIIFVLVTAPMVFLGCRKAEESAGDSHVTASDTATDKGPTASTNGLPRLLDLGAGKCIPCKMMEPILEELKKEYAGRLEVVFVDVWQDAEAGAKYGIQSIPTQIFFDASGKELFRHTGVFSKEDILAKWKELEVAFQENKSLSSSPAR